MNYLRTFGPAADPATRLNWGLIAISLAVTAIIGILVLWAALRRRPPLVPDESGRLPVGSSRGGLRWITIGVALSTLALLASTIWTVQTLAAIAVPPRVADVHIKITSYQWWWAVEYTGRAPGQTFVTANEIHIPVGEPVRLTLVSSDVIHSFWIPQLAGKTDVIPGQENHTWLQADRAGVYRGQCAEFCGAQHAHMALHVIADERAQFDAWRAAQLQPLANAAAQTPGARLFAQHCAVCHTVRGTDAQGRLGPDLTHLMARAHIAAGILPNNTGALHGWVADAQAVKPGALMPAMQLPADDLHSIVDFLLALQ
jgi:cytochrome c oxidase subunit 2